MTRIGFAYNQRPDPIAPTDASDASEPAHADEEPPSRDGALATVAPAARARAVADDEFAEWDGPQTIDAVERALARHGTVVRLEATDDFPDRLRQTRPDIVFNIAEGLRGPNREAHVPAICEFYGVPYSGSDPLTLALCLDKARTKEILRAHAVPTADWLLVRSMEQLYQHVRLGTPALRLPLFVKPVHEGSSKGITERNFVARAHDLGLIVGELLERYQQPVIIEQFLPGAEFTCGVLGNGASARVLPIVGLDFGALPSGALPIYGFEAKWLWDRPDHPLRIFSCPAPIGSTLRDEIRDVVLRTFHALGCRDWARVDVRQDGDGRVTVVEVNPLPGILPDPADNSCLPMAARAAGLDYDALIGSCLEAAADRQGVRLRRETQ
jgi:D-alanine-D-alanine ligase